MNRPYYQGKVLANADAAAKYSYSEKAHSSGPVAQVPLIDQRACKSLGWRDVAAEKASSEETGNINKQLMWPKTTELF